MLNSIWKSHNFPKKLNCHRLLSAMRGDHAPVTTGKCAPGQATISHRVINGAPIPAQAVITSGRCPCEWQSAPTPGNGSQDKVTITPGWEHLHGRGAPWSATAGSCCPGAHQHWLHQAAGNAGKQLECWRKAGKQLECLEGKAGPGRQGSS